MINQFTDKFKFLKTEDAKIQTLRTRVTQILNKLIPSRILSKANIFNLTLDLSQDFTNMMMFYIEDSLQESNIAIAQKESSVRGLAAVTGHQATRAISSRGVVRCTLKPGIQLLTPKLVLSNVKAHCQSNNLQYTANIPGDVQEISTSTNSFDLELIEGQLKTVRYIADGSKLFTIELDDTDAIENYDISVTVDNIKFDKYDSLYDMGANTNGYLSKNGYSNQVDIIFGDDIHGKKLDEGSTILVTYRITQGETGNIETTNAIFNIISGIYNANGAEIDATEYLTIKVQSGFHLASNGEDIETTRLLAGFNSRALVFVKPENLKAYLSRLTILSHIDVWSDDDENVFNMLLLPNVMNKFKRYSDYLYAHEASFVLPASTKQDIRHMIDTSRRQATSTEIVMHDPIFRKYAVFVYIDALINDKDSLRSSIEDKISAVMISQTFVDTDMSSQTIISKSAIVDAIYAMPEIKNLSLDIISEQNESARINQYHDYTIAELIGSARQTRLRRKQIPANVNPNLGFTDLGDLQTDNRITLPILRGGFKRFVDSENTVDIDKPIYIFYKTITGSWDQL